MANDQFRTASERGSNEPGRAVATRSAPVPLAERVNLSTKEAAEYSGVSEQYLRELRMNGARVNHIAPPPYIKLSARKVVYRRADLDAWLETYRVVPGATKTVAA